MTDAAHMQRALALAAPGVGGTGDNPSVGCVIVKAGAIVGEGATAEGGRPHAEEIALAAAADAARGATAYVTLEPCAKRSTAAPACADRLIQAGLSRVVIATHDPHPNAAGAGVERMRNAGIAVEIGLMQAEARAQNAAFFAKWGSSSDDGTTMSAAEARFRQVERVLDERLAALRSNMRKITVHDWCARNYHYKNQVLTWCYQLVQERELEGETARISVFLTYTEPLNNEDNLSVLIRGEVFQQGQTSRIDRRHEFQTPTRDIELAGFERLIERAFAQGAELLQD